MNFECIHFTPYEKGTIQGFADIYVPKMHITFYGLIFHKKNAQEWINFPSKSYEKEGELKWIPYFKFDHSEHKKVFIEKCLTAIKLKLGENNHE